MATQIWARLLTTRSLSRESYEHDARSTIALSTAVLRTSKHSPLLIISSKNQLDAILLVVILSPANATITILSRTLPVKVEQNPQRIGLRSRLILNAISSELTRSSNAIGKSIALQVLCSRLPIIIQDSLENFSF